ncbi:unnamed protein product [Arctia plantaginis]|uniref:Uncharacterized protein n=1 Tax=Arctia plantaginis TaxID=874455 RepID=A0A8S0ZPU5_ARCPL|nr:unnamed protein product [Arctia plantaginis]
MVRGIVLCWLVGGLLFGQIWGISMPYQSEGHPLTLVSELTSRLGSHPARLQDARLSLPTPQDLEAIKKVAQILIMLGQQVIPAIIGEPQTSPVPGEPIPAGENITSDPVTLDKQTSS